MSTPNPNADGPVELPSKDGYYWMHNLSYDGNPMWRIVEMGYSEQLRERVAHEHGVYLTTKSISSLKEVSFYGPLNPPNKQAEL